MKFAIYIPIFGPYGDPHTIINLAREVEKAGWDGFFIWDQITGFEADPVVDVAVALTAIALNTERIRFGAMVTPLARRRPVKYAREMLSLDRLSNGRLICGIGLGNSTEEFEDLGEPADLKVRAAMLDEGLEVVNGLWSGEAFSFSGQYYQIKDAVFLPKPTQQPRIPIWTAGGWPGKAPFRRAARWDGVFALRKNAALDEMMPAEEYRKMIEFIQTQRSSNAPFDVVHSGKLPLDAQEAAATVQAYTDAGVTWWMENVSPWTYGGINDDKSWNVDAMFSRITQGPPRS